MKRQYPLWWPALSAMLLVTAASPALAQTKLILAHNAGGRDASAPLPRSSSPNKSRRGKWRTTYRGCQSRRRTRGNLEMLTSLRAGKLDMSINFHGTLATVVPEVAAFGLPLRLLIAKEDVGNSGRQRRKGTRRQGREGGYGRSGVDGWWKLSHQQQQAADCQAGRPCAA